MKLREQIRKSLENAYDNGYELISYSATEIAEDIAQYDSQFENIKPAKITPFIEEWITEQTCGVKIGSTYKRKKRYTMAEVIAFERAGNYTYIIFKCRVGIGKCRLRLRSNVYRMSMSAFNNTFKLVAQ